MSQKAPTSYPSDEPGYADYFSDNATNKPVILDDGTSVVFPMDWTDEDADKWRKGMELQRPPQTIDPGHRIH
jgi:hypothetical protein